MHRQKISENKTKSSVDVNDLPPNRSRLCRCTRSRLLSSLQFSYQCISTGLHPLTSSTSFVRWQMSRLVSDYVPARLLHWLSAARDCLPSATELFQSPLLVSGTVCTLRASCLPVLSENVSHPYSLHRARTATLMLVLTLQSLLLLTCYSHVCAQSMTSLIPSSFLLLIERRTSCSWKACSDVCSPVRLVL